MLHVLTAIARLCVCRFQRWKLLLLLSFFQNLKENQLKWTLESPKSQRTIAGNEKLEQQENNDKQQTKEEERGRIPSEKTMKRKKNKYRILE